MNRGGLSAGRRQVRQQRFLDPRSTNTHGCRHGICDAAFYNWKSKYGRMAASDLNRKKEMEGDELSELAPAPREP